MCLGMSKGTTKGRCARRSVHPDGQRGHATNGMHRAGDPSAGSVEGPGQLSHTLRRPLLPPFAIRGPWLSPSPSTRRSRRSPTVGSWAHPRTCRLGEPPTREVNHFLIHFCFPPNRENPDSSRAEPDFLQFRGLTVLTFEDGLYYVNDDTKDPKPPKSGRPKGPFNPASWPSDRRYSGLAEGRSVLRRLLKRSTRKEKIPCHDGPNRQPKPIIEPAVGLFFYPMDWRADTKILRMSCTARGVPIGALCDA